MLERPRKPLFPNPFYAILLVFSTLFAVTALAYLVSGIGFDTESAPQAAGHGQRSKALAAWFDRYGPLALGIEFVVMLLFGFLAMVTDQWFAGKSARSGSGPR